MIQIILSDDIEKSKIDALVQFLKTWNINAELKRTFVPKKKKDKEEFSLAAGIWEGYDIEANELRKNAWNRGK